MANRSLWPEGCEVHQEHLEYDTTERIKSIKLRTGHSAKYGVVSGLVLSVDTTNNSINMTAGGGYTPSGEYVEYATNANFIVDQTNNEKTYVYLVYTESLEDLEAHESDGTVKPTRAVGASMLRVVKSADYAAWLETSANMAVNAKDRALLVGIVTGMGSGSTPQITAPTVFGEAKYVSPQPSNITGITVISVSGNTPTGTGTLYFTAAKAISWQAPGDTSAGQPVTITNSDSVTLQSSTSAYTILIDVAYTRLPIDAQQDSLTVSNLYSQEVSRFTAVDAHHRSLVGGGQPTSNNPHGMTMDDLAPGVAGSLEQHQDIMHSNGIGAGSSSMLLSCEVQLNSTLADTLLVQDFTEGDSVYINGRRIERLASDATNIVNFDDAGTDNVPYLFGVYVSQDGYLFKQVRAKLSGNDLIDRLFLINASDNITSGTYVISLNTSGVVTFDDGPGATVFANDTSGKEQIVRLYSKDGIRYVDVFVKHLSPPTSTKSISVEFFAEPDVSQCLQVSYVHFLGGNYGNAGYGFGGSNLTAPNRTFDRRTYGTLMPENINTNAGYESLRGFMSDNFPGDSFLALPVRKKISSAWKSEGAADITPVLTDEYSIVKDDYWFSVKSQSGLNFTVAGGVAYINGLRKTVSTATLTIQQTDGYTYIYVTKSGVISQTGAPDASSFKSALYNLSFTGDPEIGLYLVRTAGSAVSSTIDLREYSYRRIGNDVQFGQVGLDKYNRAIIKGTNAGLSGSALTVVGAGTSPALLVEPASTSFTSYVTEVKTLHAVSSGGVPAIPYNQGGIRAEGSGDKAAVTAVAFDSGPGVFAASGTGAGVYAQGGEAAHTASDPLTYGKGAGVYGVGGASTAFGVVGIGGIGDEQLLSGLGGIGPASIGVMGVGSAGGEGVFGLAGGTAGAGVHGYGGTSPNADGVYARGSTVAATWGVRATGGNGGLSGGGIIGIGGTGSLGSGSDGVRGIGGGTAGSGGYFSTDGGHANGAYAIKAHSQYGQVIKLDDSKGALTTYPNFSPSASDPSKQKPDPLDLNVYPWLSAGNSISSANIVNNWVVFEYGWVSDPNNLNNVLFNTLGVKCARNFSHFEIANENAGNANIRLWWTKKLVNPFQPVFVSCYVYKEKNQPNNWMAFGGDGLWHAWQYRVDETDDGSYTRIQIAANEGGHEALERILTDGGSGKATNGFALIVSVMVVGPVQD